ncbi:MAG: hypothetical protein JNG85_03090 [Spirochaetaceae bacterium]|nr:hypothetical protein [Spirochaetaceae bacterium]
MPTTLNDSAVPYTVVGGAKARASGTAAGTPVSVLLLDRGARLYRNEVFRELDRLGFESIVSVEEGVDAVDVESLSQRYPQVRFLLLQRGASPGEKINLGIRESQAPFVFALWSDMRLSSAGLSGRFFERLGEQNHLCLAPFLSARKGEVLPSAATPAFQRQNLRILPLAPAKDGTKSLYPFDYVGIYSREKFVLSGGYDAGIANPYWQKLDFGFRAWLWGEEIRQSQALRVAYDEDPPAEDSTPDEDYKWFWLKNLAPTFRGDSALIPPARYWSYLRRRGGRPFAAAREFRAAAEWVRTNSFRFRSDATSVVDLWEDESP